MKQCPNCKTTYPDETLRFCLEDGSTLISLANAEKTMVMSIDETVEMRSAKTTNPVRVDIQKDDAPESVSTLISPAFLPQLPVQNSEQKSSNWAIIGILGGLLIFVLLGFVGFAAYVFFKPELNDNRDSAVTSPTPKSSQTTDTDENLKEKVANLEKQIENQKSTNSSNLNPLPTETTNIQKTARVNSPRDGFLALRSAPNTETGYRITKIPHGATFTVFGCLKSPISGNIKGRWCQVNYNGQEGWAFDAYMIFE